MGKNTTWDLARGLLLASCLAAFGCSGGGDDGGGPGGTGDGDGDGDTSEPDFCEDNDECSDGVFCNGEERCNPDHEDADAFGCLAAADEPCSDGDMCDEAGEACGCVDPDADGDGHDSESCGGDDCDDDDANRYPGNGEVCDAEHHDEDCNPETFGYRDQDGDDDPDENCCNEDESGDLICGTDCNDNRGNQHSFNTEVCDDIDNDCDGLVDEAIDGDEDDGLKRVFTVDMDEDGWGSAADDADTVFACEAPEGYVESATDCDDDDNQVSPSATEVCDDVDNDCDGLTDETIDGTEDDGLKILYTEDGDNDGYAPDGSGLQQVLACTKPTGYAAPRGDCNDADSAINPGRIDLCSDNIDNDCSGVVSDPVGGCLCEGNETRSCAENGLLGQCATATQNCNDGEWDDCPLQPGTAPEVCDVGGVDEDCDGKVNEVTDLLDPSTQEEIDDSMKETFYRDRDGDGYPNLSQSAQYCPDLEPAGWTTDENPEDCYDVALTTDPLSDDIHPGAVEVCNGRDDNCVGGVDELPLTGEPSVESTTFMCVDGDWDVDDCPAGQLHCDTNINNGCETDMFSLSDCGACGTTCALSCKPNNNSATCVEFAQLGPGDYHMCGILTDGTAACWGEGANGRLGNGGTADQPRPSSVDLLSNVTQIEAGGSHTCAIVGSSPGTLYCWGADNSGQLGNGPSTTGDRVQPSAVSVGASFNGVDIAVGYQHSCAINAGDNSAVLCWGSRANGQTGVGSTSGSDVSPTKAFVDTGSTPVNMRNVIAVGAGQSHTCVLASGDVDGAGTVVSGAVFCAGSDVLGQNGNASANTYASAFTQVNGLSGVVELAVGGSHNCVRFANGTVSCWGRNDKGQVGQAPSGPVVVPTLVEDIGDVTRIFARGNISCALSSGNIICWGENNVGQLGDAVAADGARITNDAPELVDATELAVGYASVCALSGSLPQGYCWGGNGVGQLGVGSADASQHPNPLLVEPLAN